MKKAIILTVILIAMSISLFCEKIEIYGKVVDKITKNGIGDATVIIFPTGDKVKTKDNGNFFLEVEDSKKLNVQILKQGYKSL